MKNFHYQFFLIIIFTSLKSFQTAYILPTMSSIVPFSTHAVTCDDDDDEYNMMLTLAKEQAQASFKLASSIETLSSSIETLSLSNNELIVTNSKLVSTNQDLYKKMGKLQEAKDALAKTTTKTKKKTTTKTKKKTKPCRFFSTEEGCKFGEECNFLHSTEAIP